jgi:hypothetical protein
MRAAPRRCPASPPPRLSPDRPSPPQGRRLRRLHRLPHRPGRPRLQFPPVHPRHQWAHPECRHPCPLPRAPPKRRQRRAPPGVPPSQSPGSARLLPLRRDRPQAHRWVPRPRLPVPSARTRRRSPLKTQRPLQPRPPALARPRPQPRQQRPGRRQRSQGRRQPSRRRRGPRVLPRPPVPKRPRRPLSALRCPPRRVPRDAHPPRSSPRVLRARRRGPSLIHHSRRARDDRAAAMVQAGATPVVRGRG